MYVYVYVTITYMHGVEKILFVGDLFASPVHVLPFRNRRGFFNPNPSILYSHLLARQSTAVYISYIYRD